jgi:transposase-like protein
MSTQKRKSYTADFKAQVGLAAIHGVKTISEIAQDYGVHPVQVGQWKKEITAGASDLFAKKRGRKSTDEQAEKDRLYGEIGRLKMDLDWLKKKSGISL